MGWRWVNLALSKGYELITRLYLSPEAEPVPAMASKIQLQNQPPQFLTLEFKRPLRDGLEFCQSTRGANTKIRQFAAEAVALDVGAMRDIPHLAQRYSLLICLLYHALVQTRDELVEMLLKRMRRTTTAAKKRLQELQDQHRELEEQMLAVFADVLDQTIHMPDDNATLGRGVRAIFEDHGGAEALRERYEQVSAYHKKNYRPLMWGFYSPYRAELFRLSYVLTFCSATQHQSLIEALRYIQRFQNVRRDHLPYEISLDFASVRWQALIRTRHTANRP